jgi:hypothetical protein
VGRVKVVTPPEVTGALGPDVGNSAMSTVAPSGRPLAEYVTAPEPFDVHNSSGVEHVDTVGVADGSGPVTM